jgi:hypothetical protein
MYIQRSILAHAVIGSLDLNAIQAQWNDGVDFTNHTNDTNVTVIKIQDQIIHPLWDPNLDRYDIMILILETSALPNHPVVRLNRDSSFPTVPTTSLADNGSGGGDHDDDKSLSLTAIGFGLGSTDPFQLHNVTLGYVPNAQCVLATNGTITYEGFIYDDMMCTLAVNRSVCYGDSGGPLLLTTPTGDDIQVGVSSWYVHIYREHRTTRTFFLVWVWPRVSAGQPWLGDTFFDTYMVWHWGSVSFGYAVLPMLSFKLSCSLSRTLCLCLIAFGFLFLVPVFCEQKGWERGAGTPPFQVSTLGRVKVLTLFVNKSVNLLPTRPLKTTTVPNYSWPQHSLPRACPLPNTSIRRLPFLRHPQCGCNPV